MVKQATGSFEVKNWEEQPVSEREGQPKLVRANVVYAYHGDLEDEGQIAFVMCYSSNNIAYFTGYERVTGRLGEQTGSFVLHHHGTFEQGAVKDTLTIVPGSATAELSGLRGSGISGGDGEARYTLDYESDISF